MWCEKLSCVALSLTKGKVGNTIIIPLRQTEHKFGVTRGIACTVQREQCEREVVWTVPNFQTHPRGQAWEKEVLVIKIICEHKEVREDFQDMFELWQGETLLNNSSSLDELLREGNILAGDDPRMGSLNWTMLLRCNYGICCIAHNYTIS